MTPAFTYPALVDPTKDIRLLTLHAGEPHDPICCSLYSEELRHDLQFEALSYVWGSKEPGQMILVNDQAFKITLNLNAALLRLRLPYAKRTIWVDAICINQTNEQERGLQVGLMRKIYSWTDCAILWFGEEPELSEPAINSDLAAQIQQILDASDALLESTLGLLRSSNQVIESSSSLLPDAERHKHQTSQADLESIFTPEQTGSDLPPDGFTIGKTLAVDWTDAEFYVEGHQELRNRTSLADDSIFHAFCLFRDLSADICLHEIDYPKEEAEGQHTYLTNARRAVHWLMQRSWWSRIWTVQECVLPIISVLHYGPVKAPFSMLLNATANFMRHRATCCAAVPGVGDMLNVMVDTCGELKRVRLDQLVNGSLDLCTLLRVFRSRNASDKRDKVYALLPLSAERDSSRVLLEANYDRGNTPGAVFIDITITLLQMMQNLDILSQPSHVQKNETLPSWVADYSFQAASANTQSWYYRQLGLYKAGKWRSASISVIGSRFLVLEGVYIDTVDIVSTGMFYTNEHANANVLREWHAAIEDYSKRREIASDWSSAFWRTICGDCVPPDPDLDGQQDLRRMMDSDMSLRNIAHELSLLRWVLPESWPQSMRSTGATTNAGALSEIIKATTHGRKFFITKNGHMGVGPFYSGLQYPRVERIFVCAGGKVPLVFQEAGEKEIPSVGKVMTHELMGDCYLHGFMDGAGMQDFEAKKQTLYVV